MRIRKPFSQIEWSNRSMVHNLFRLFEFAFGRKVGIRIENRTIQIGTFVYREFYTTEARLAFYEAELYELVKRPIRFVKKWSKVRIYRPVPVYGAVNPIGYVFAIALDNSTTEKANENGSPDTTVSHTTSGSDRGLLFQYAYGIVSDAGNASSVTYNGDSLTAEAYQYKDNRGLGVWSLIAPDTGSNTGVVTFSGGSQQDKAYGFITLTGVDQTDMVEATATAVANYPDSTPGISITTLTDDAWAIGVYVDREGGTFTTTAGTQIYNVTSTSTGVGIRAGYQNGSAGSKTIEWTRSTSGDSGPLIALSVKPLGGGGGYLGNIKSIAGVAQANIKSIGGVPVDNIKSVGSVSNV